IYLVGMGYLSIAALFLIHALSTPGVIISGNTGVTSWSAVISLVLGGLFFAVSGFELSPAHNYRLMQYARSGLLALLSAWLGVSVVALLVVPALSGELQIGSTHTIEAAPIAVVSGASSEAAVPAATVSLYSAEGTQKAGLPILANDLQWGLATIGLLCYAFAATQHYRLYRQSPSPAGLALVSGIVLFGEAILTQRLAAVYTTMFWLYHVEEFIGFGVISYACLIAYRRGQSQLGLLDSLLLGSTRDRMQLAYGQVLDSLIDMLSRGESHTRPQIEALRRRFGMTETQVSVLQRAAAGVAQERKQRQELEHLNAMLRQLEQDKEQLMQMVVHDLKNPLTALIGFLEILRMDQLTSEQQQLLDGALRSGKNLSGLIGDLLDIGQIEEGRLELNRSTFAVRDLLTDCAAELSAWLAQDGKLLRIDSP
ncbi:MAG TPA: histidine kinase dimerization/phospho-acceptor domain-containing protein, partial [Roseiflexaceae bacterium]|nr:histidine kinase dimerization/phospho-acceptor domain-containing protein [Roseiflexaceae bacterium]